MTSDKTRIIRGIISTSTAFDWLRIDSVCHRFNALPETLHELCRNSQARDYDRSQWLLSHKARPSLLFYVYKLRRDEGLDFMKFSVYLLI